MELLLQFCFTSFALGGFTQRELGQALKLLKLARTRSSLCLYLPWLIVDFADRQITTFPPGFVETFFVFISFF